jgi:hypothetical protein
VCYKDRIIIPAKLRPQVLETIHAAHQGMSGIISRVEDTVFWPGICTDIIKMRGGCLTCIRDAPSQPAGTPVTPPIRGAEFVFCPTPRSLRANLSNEACMSFCRNRNKRSVILGLRCTILKNHWTMCPIFIGKSV